MASLELTQSIQSVTLAKKFRFESSESYCDDQFFFFVCVNEYSFKFDVMFGMVVLKSKINFYESKIIVEVKIGMKK